MALLVLDDHRPGRARADLEIEHRRGILEGDAQVARADLEGDRLGPGAIDDPRHVAGTAQAAGGARASLGALLDGEGWTRAVGHGGGSLALTSSVRARAATPARGATCVPVEMPVDGARGSILESLRGLHASSTPLDGRSPSSRGDSWTPH